jgi:hypothetical protein
MTQPTFADGPPVPLMTEGIIDAATLSRLIAELVTHATAISVREKAAANAYAGPDHQPLDSVLERLLTGATRSVQIRYHFDGHDWTDTIVALPMNFRVLRCQST